MLCSTCENFFITPKILSFARRSRQTTHDLPQKKIPSSWKNHPKIIFCEKSRNPSSKKPKLSKLQPFNLSTNSKLTRIHSATILKPMNVKVVILNFLSDFCLISFLSLLPAFNSKELGILPFRTLFQAFQLLPYPQQDSSAENFCFS